MSGIGLLVTFAGERATTALGQTNAIQAKQNLSLDPWGRVIDVSLSQPVSLTAPWDRFRFDIESSSLSRGTQEPLSEI